MKTLLLLLTTALGTGFAVRATLTTERNASAVRTLGSERDELRNQISQEQQRLQAVRQATADAAAVMAAGGQMTPTGAAAAKTKSSPATVTDAQRTAPGPKLSAITRVANDPQRIPEALRDYRTQLRLGNLQAIGLSGAQIEALKDLMVEKEQRRMDLVAAVETQGLDQKGDTFKTLKAEIDQWQQKMEAEILGDLEPAYREYVRAQWVRWGVTAFVLASLDTGEPVSAAQFERVTQILAATCERIESGPKTGNLKSDTVNWNAAGAQLQGVLTPSQIETLRRHYQSDMEGEKLEKQIWERENLLTAQFQKQQPKP